LSAVFFVALGIGYILLYFLNFPEKNALVETREKITQIDAGIYQFLYVLTAIHFCKNAIFAGFLAADPLKTPYFSEKARISIHRAV
jgi:hypothetical protein